ncbi:MAG: choice-of-anchor Q domain-containing protein, partial [Myxococcota bacterium]
LTLCVEVPDCRAGIEVDEYVMFDHLHPTSAVHDLWAQAALAVVPAACGNGVDEDGDGRIDFGSDPGCESASDPSELSIRQCDNGRDDDNDGTVDWRGDGTGDPHCANLSDKSEFPPPPRVQAAGPPLRVTTFDDELNSDGDCSLREAIQAANSDAAVDACPAGSGADAILLRAGSYLLGSAGQLVITSDLAIRGTGNGRTVIDAAHHGRVFHVAAGTVELSRLTLQNGRAAFDAGILNHGAVTLFRSTVRSNTAVISNGGISNYGTMAIVDSFVVDNTATREFDGGIFNAAGATLIIDRSTVSGNTATLNNGGIVNLGAMEIADSTVSGNNADQSVGGIANLATMVIVDSSVSDNTATREFNGGIFNEAGATLTVVDSSVSGNIANLSNGGVANLGAMVIAESSVTNNVARSEFNGGVFNDAGATLTLVNSTVSGNTAEIRNGGIFSFGALEVVNSTVSDNSAGQNGGIVGGAGSVTLKSSIVARNAGGDCRGAITSAGHNLDSDNTCNLTAAGDLPAVDPMLGPLADNGGPTETHSLLPGSPAIDAIAVADCTDLDGDPVVTDQRGVARPQGAGCDIGAFERAVGPTQAQ